MSMDTDLTDEELDALAERLFAARTKSGDTWRAVAREAARWAEKRALAAPQAEHVTSMDCWCKPQRDAEVPSVVVHNDVPPATPQAAQVPVAVVREYVEARFALEAAQSPARVGGRPRRLRHNDERMVRVRRALGELEAAARGRGTQVPQGYAEALAEVERATRKFPTWPTDPLHALAVLGEEFGELTKAVLQTVYEPHKVEPGELRTEAIQTAAMALRFFASLDAYRFERSEQHHQSLAAAQAQGVANG